MRGFLIGWAVAAVLAVATIWAAGVHDNGTAFLIGCGYGAICLMVGMWLEVLND